MDPTTIDAVSKLGFPIVAALGLGYVIWRLAQWGIKTGDRLATRFESHVDSLDQKFDSISPKLDRIESKIDNKQGCKADTIIRPGTAHA